MCLPSSMNILNYNYLKPKHLEGFSRYKYQSIDDSPLSKYIINPMWDKTVLYLPSWLAPNLMTFFGFLLTVINILLLTIFDYNFYASTKIYSSKYPPVPRWVWLICAINQFLAYALDSCDGKQARKTKTSSPLGELFDHGLDSWATMFVPLCLYSLYGRADSGLPPYNVFFALWGVLMVFLIAHWEKYITGIFYLPWAYDPTQIALSIIFFLTFLKDFKFWHFNLDIGIITINPGQMVEIAVYVSAFVTSLPIALLHIHKFYTDPTINPGKQRISLFQSLKPLIPILYLFVITFVWIKYSPNDIINQEPRLYFFLMGTVYSNIVSKIVLAQMTDTSAKAWNFLLTPLTIFVIGITVFGWMQTLAAETFSLYFLLTFSIITHLHFGIRIVNQLCSYLDIYCFTITKKPSKKIETKTR